VDVKMQERVKRMQPNANAGTSQYQCDVAGPLEVSSWPGRTARMSAWTGICDFFFALLNAAGVPSPVHHSYDQ